jgi:hypothetical protein
MSEVKVNKISPRTNCGTTQLGDAGDTITVTGDLKSNSLKSASGSTITLGQSGDTIQLGCGASQTGFGRTGTVDWNTTAITADPANAVSGTGYFANTTSAAFTITLPTSPSAGDIVAVRDYAQTFATNNLTIGRNGQPIDGGAFDLILSTNGAAVTLVYVDGTQGWKSVNSNETINEIRYVTAVGGTITCCGDYKIHTFTSPGTFTVTCEGSAGGSNTVEYLVVAGGGSGAAKGPGDSGGGGGAGGFRFASPSLAPLTFPGKPLNAPAGLPVSATGYPITVGGGGAGNPAPGGPCAPSGNGSNGSNSVFSTITSAGGGKGGYGAPRTSPDIVGSPGGSGGGGGSGSCQTNVGGTGNTPPVSPPQGNNGGSYIHPASPNSQGGAGGGALAAGCGGSGPINNGGAGGGLPTGFGSNGVPCGSFRYYAGGGAGGRRQPACGTGGVGGGGNTNCSGTANTGGGGGGGGANGSPAAGGDGGSGIVVIRYKYQ